jgi:hypothetical protein
MRTVTTRQRFFVADNEKSLCRESSAIFPQARRSVDLHRRQRVARSGDGAEPRGPLFALSAIRAAFGGAECSPETARRN